MFKGDFADTCPKNSRWCRWWAERRVKRAQTRERGPLLVPAEYTYAKITHHYIQHIYIYNLIFLTYSRLGSAYSMDGKDVQAAECFHQAEQIYMVVPGEGSCFYKKKHFWHVYHNYLEM